MSLASSFHVSAKNFRTVASTASLVISSAILLASSYATALTGTLNSTSTVPTYVNEFGLSDERTDIVANIYMTDGGELFTASQDLNRVGVFSQSGTFLRNWGGPGISYGPTAAPNEYFGIGDFAQLSNGNILIFDADNGLVKTVQQDGTFVTQHEVSAGTKLVVDSADNVYIATWNAVTKYDTSWNVVTTWGSSGTGNGQFGNIWGMGIDSSDNVYVSDNNLNRIQKFDSDGNYLLQWGTAGSGNGQFTGPNGIAADASDNIYVVDWAGDRVQKFDNAGNYLLSFGSSGSGDGQLYRPDDVAVDASGNVYVADTLNYRMVKFDSAGNFLFNFGDPPSKLGQLWHPANMAIDTAGNRYVTDDENHRVQKFDANNNFVTSWGLFNVADPGFQVPWYIDTDSANNVYVNDVNGRIRKFDSNGNFIYTITISGSAVYRIGGLTVGADDTFYVVNTTAMTIQHYDSVGNYLGEWGTSGTADNQLNQPCYIDIDSDNNLYVLDATLNRVQKFTSDGTFIKTWGTGGSGDGQFNSPIALTAASVGMVYVMDTSNYRVQAFDTEGNFVSKWGSYGTGPNEFIESYGITADTAGSVYTVDYEQYRVQKFSYVNDSGQVTTTSGGTACVQIGSGSSFTGLTSITPADPNVDYPYGAIDYTYDASAPGASANLQVFFESTMLPTDAQAVLYDTVTSSSTVLPGYVITSTTQCGKTGLLITFSTTDGGSGDSDTTSNGTVETVLGLTSISSNVPNVPGGGSGTPPGGGLENTGVKVLVVSGVACLLIGGAVWVQRSKRYTRYFLRVF